MKRMTKKQLEKYIEDKFGNVNNYGSWGRTRYIPCLCCEMILRSGFREHWNKINTDKKLFCYEYMGYEEGFDYEEVSFLRLLTLHLFLRGE